MSETFRKKKTSFKEEWVRAQAKLVRAVISKEKLSNEALIKYLLDLYDTKENPIGHFHNNILKHVDDMSLEDFVNAYLNKDMAVTGYGVCYKQQKDADSISREVLDTLLSTRKQYKKKMLSCKKGSEEYKYYNIMQMSYKVLK